MKQFLNLYKVFKVYCSILYEKTKLYIILKILYLNKILLKNYISYAPDYLIYNKNNKLIIDRSEEDYSEDSSEDNVLVFNQENDNYTNKIFNIIVNYIICDKNKGYMIKHTTKSNNIYKILYVGLFDDDPMDEYINIIDEYKYNEITNKFIKLVNMNDMIHIKSINDIINIYNNKYIFIIYFNDKIKYKCINLLENKDYITNKKINFNIIEL